MLSYLRRKTDCAYPEVSSEFNDLQVDVLCVFFRLTVGGYTAWHLLSTTMRTPDAMFRAYIIALVVVPVLVASHFLLARNWQAARGMYLAGSFLAIFWALYVLQQEQVTLLYPLLALVVTFVVSPLAGLATVLTSTCALILFADMYPNVVHSGDVIVVATFSIFAVASVWVLTDRLYLLLHWYAVSYAQAEERARESRDHRAQLLQAWKQLDMAYYRLEHLNAALRLAWKAAEAAERAKLELAMNISHELRTPLNLIVGYSEMMLTSPGSYGDIPLPRTYRGDLDAIHRAAQHLLALTDDVLDLARVDVGHLGLAREPVNLAQIIQEAVDLVKDYIEAKGLRVSLDLPDDSPVLLLDRLRIRQVLLNLLSNAARFTEQGVITIEVRLRERDVLVRVSDTGPGIPPEELPHVFDQFVTHGQPQDGWHSGTGLGLPISKYFVELHHGTMGVESTVGSGTTFWFTLPRTSAVGAATTSGPPILIPKSLPVPPTVVLIEPDRQILHLLQRHLGVVYRVEAAAAWPDGVKQAVDARASIILANANVSFGPEFPPVPVVRYSLSSATLPAEQFEVQGYLVKPVSRHALLTAIRGLDRPIRTVLIVDDDARFVRLMTRMIEASGEGYITLAAHNGEEALVLMRRTRPDLVLLDQTMPGLDGSSVLQQMKSDPKLKEIAVIIVSAHARGERDRLFGTEVHIDYPMGFQMEDLAQLVRPIVESGLPARANLAATEGLLPAAFAG
jgi:signal transduction histidine kinase/CheY-like chemotaxis protein